MTSRSAPREPHVTATPPPKLDRTSHRTTRQAILEVFASRDILANMVRRDFTIKYKNSFLGVGWSLFNPILLTLLFAGVFAALGFSPAPGTPYPFVLYFFAGLILWNLFAASVQGNVSAILNGAYLVKKVYFPREILTFSTILSNLITFAFEFIVVLIAIIITYVVTAIAPSTMIVQVPVKEDGAFVIDKQTGETRTKPRRVCTVARSKSFDAQTAAQAPRDVDPDRDCAPSIIPSPTLLIAPLFIAIVVFLAASLSLLIASLTVYFRDMEHLVGVAMQMWFWLTPVLYSMSLINVKSPILATYIWPLNPMQPLVVGFRQVVLDGTLPKWGWIATAEAGQPLGTSWGWILYSFLFAICFFLAGYRYFNKHETQFAELI
jgi:ABC-type polysaccharide/polyol phosphate export permease